MDAKKSDPLLKYRGIIFFVKMNEVEIWKDVMGYESLYEISNTGKIKALEKIRETGKTGTTIRIYPEKILKPSTGGRAGYEIVSLNKYGKRRYFTVHRLVALHFIPNPENLPIINHKDSDRVNNNVNNLEWCDHKYNYKHSFDKGRQVREFTETNNPSSIKVKCIKTGNVFESQKIAWRETKYPFCYETFLRNIRKSNNNTNCEIL